MKKSLFVLFFVSFFINFTQNIYCQQKDNLPDNIDFWSNYPNEVLAKAIVDRMTEEELYSQILMFGWAGSEPDNLLYQWVNRGLGSVKVFGWNTEDINLVAKSITALQKTSARGRFKIPLFVATDQEGGWIRHVKGETANTPGNMAIGASGYPVDAWKSGYYINKEIKALGINMNFAPTVDLFTDHESTIIGTRSFGENPEHAGILGFAFACGSIASGVIPTAKHFPGHGDTKYDSHIYLPKINVDMNELKNRELVPFEYLIKHKIPAIMSGHLALPKIDKTGAPASLSKIILTDILRNQLGFEGLIITDDMMMNGATSFAGSLSTAFRMAIEAGNDIVISSKTAKLNEPLWTYNLQLVKTNEEFNARVKDAAFRVIKAKLEYFKGNNPAPLYPDANTISQFIPDKEGQIFFLEQACRSISLHKKTDFPVTAQKAGRVLLVGSLPRFFSEGRKRYPNSGEFRFSYELGPNETQWACDNIVNMTNSYDTIIVCVSSERSARIADALKNSGKKVIIFSIMSPVNAFNLEWADEILLGYSYSGYTFVAMYGALNGEYEVKGTMPFTK